MFVKEMEMLIKAVTVADIAFATVCDFGNNLFTFNKSIITKTTVKC